MFILPDLPYAYDALQPTVSDLTMRTHHDKHHKAYVDTTNKLLADQGRQPSSLEEVVKQAGAEGQKKLFNQSGQAWNHGFFWESMAPGGARPDGALAQAIQTGFGGLDQLKARFVDEGVNHFASGWVWLVARGPALEVISTHDGESALTRDDTPLLVCDLWEHAYYLDYKNLRKDFLEKWFDTVANWGFAGRQYAAACGQGDAWRYPAPVANA